MAREEARRADQAPSSFRELRTGPKAATGDRRVLVQLLTDPWSVWCWGFEPVRRTLELRYSSVEFRFLLGGMFPRMPHPREAGFDVERFFAVVQRTTGMPIGADVVKNDPADSTYPACVHVHAVRLAAPERERAYLRALREAVYLDGLNISRPEVGLRVAERVGVDRERFRAALRSGEARAAFEREIATLHAQGLHAYPTLLISMGDRVARVEGFQSLPAVLGVVESVSGRRPAPRPDPPLEQVVPEGERVATREVAEVLGVSLERAHETLLSAQKHGGLRRERQPGGDVWSRPAVHASA